MGSKVKKMSEKLNLLLKVMDGLHCRDVYETHSPQQHCLIFLSTKLGHNPEEILEVQK
jgi:hypothetical protein